MELGDNWVMLTLLSQATVLLVVRKQRRAANCDFSGAHCASRASLNAHTRLCVYLI